MKRKLRIIAYAGASILAGILSAKCSYDYVCEPSHYISQQILHRDEYSSDSRNTFYYSPSPLGKIGAAGAGVGVTGSLLTVLLFTESFLELKKKNR